MEKMDIIEIGQSDKMRQIMKIIITNKYLRRKGIYCEAKNLTVI